MQAPESLSLGELVQCSICLETYTKPMMLPCQHTYCYSCLLYLTVNRTNIKCPQCRELHDLPPTGIKGFKENIVINNLLTLASPKEEAACSDCQLPLPVSSCDHCDQNICVECRVKHTKLSFEIDMNFKRFQESIMSEEYGKKISAEKQYFERCLDKLLMEQGRMETVFEKEIDRLVKLLITRRQYFEQYFAVIAGLYKSIIHAKAGGVEPPSFVEDFSGKLRHCKTVESLQDLRNDLSDLTNVARLVERREDDFKFVNDSITLDIGTFGRVEFGEAVVGIRGKYDRAPIEQDIEFSHESEQAIELSHESNVARNPCNATAGLCGLNNLGNTCYMNAAIQVMSNVPELTNYFLDQKWIDELNEENSLGTHGEIARAYAYLINCIWSGKYSITVPKNFKLAVSRRFAPQFSGYQYDSQELMAFLLDGLHEDLNRIKQKPPYVELKDANGRSDEIVARESWISYKERNDSIITDIFRGLLKSTLACPKCDKISVTFDPVCYLSLPLTLPKGRHVDVVYMPMDPSKKPTQYKLTVPKSGCVGHLCSALSHKVRTPPDRMVVVDVYNHRFHRIFTPEEGLMLIVERDDIFVYEIQASISENEDHVLLPVYLRERKVNRISTETSSAQLFGTPLLITVPKRTSTYQSLKTTVVQRMSRYVRVPQSEDECIFKLTLTDRYGSSDLHRVIDDGRPIMLNGKSHLAVDWNSDAKKLFFDEKESELISVNKYSMRRPRPISLRDCWPISLRDCLDLFTTPELLGAEDPWHCPECKRHQQATKKFDLWQLSNILVIHLKRFSCDRKLDVLVDFPVCNLNMNKWIQNPANVTDSMYDLIGVINHYGVGLGGGGGHYTAVAKNKNDEKWYRYDDSSVTAVDVASIRTKAAYVLVYQRRDVIE